MPDSLPDVPQDVLEGIGNAVEGVTPTPAAPINPTEPATPAAPEGTSTGEAATAAPDSFTKLDPSTLPPEVRPYYDSMLADYTRKTQEASPWRKLGDELGVSSPEDIRQAAELYTYLNDPNNLRDFHAQLGALLEGQGPQVPATPTGLDPSAFDGLEDPALQQLASRVDALQQELQRRDAMQQAEQMQWALLGEINRQEAMLKEAHPDWGEEEWNALWNTSVAFNGDLMAAAQHIEAAQNAAVTRLLNTKMQVAGTEGLVPPAAPGAVQTPQTIANPDDRELTAETAAAREYLRGIVNQSE